MRLWDGTVVLIVQLLLNFDIFTAAASTGFQEETRSELESISHKQLNLEKEFSTCLKLSRRLLSKTKNLIQHYLSDRLPGVQLTLISHLQLLPSVSLDLRMWLSLPDARRLSQIAEMLSFYQRVVQQLANFEAAKENSKFTSQFEDLGFNLRDLNHQVNYQISTWGLPSENQLEPTLLPPLILQHRSQWRNRQEVYIALSSLKCLLVRVTRDFLMLRVRVAKGTLSAKTPTPQHFPF